MSSRAARSLALALLAVGACDRDSGELELRRPLYDETIATFPSVDPERYPSMALILERTHRPHPHLLSIRFPEVPGLVADAWLFEDPKSEEVRHSTGERGVVILEHDLRDHPATLRTVVTPHPGRVEIQSTWIPDEGAEIPEQPPQPELCYQLEYAPGFVENNDAGETYADFGRRGFLVREGAVVSMAELNRTSITAGDPEKAYTDRWTSPAGASVFFPWIQRYLPTGSTATDLPDGFSEDRFDLPLVGIVSRDGRALTALASPEGRMAAQLWHHCLHLSTGWRRVGDRLDWRLGIYAMPNDPEQLLTRVRRDYPGIGGAPASR